MTKIVWPKVSYEIGGLMGFSAETVEYTAGDYRDWVKPMVEKIIHDLDMLVFNLKAENTQLRQDLKAAKPRLKWNEAAKAFVVLKG